MLRQNLKTRAISQVTQKYNSMCMFNGVPLAATDKGLFRIGGYKDDGERPIRAWMLSGKFDLGADNIKRFRYFYFGVKADGDLKLSIYADDKLVREYVVPVTTHDRQEIRVMVGRGVAARYWQWKVENIDGGFFVLYSVRAMPAAVRTGQRGG